MSKLINSFYKKVVLVTGASSCIGAATALQFAKLKAKLALAGRNEENLNEVAWKCQELGAEAPLILKADLSSELQCKNTIMATIEKFKSLDVLVNNAEIFKERSIETKSPLQYNSIFLTNVQSVYYLTMLAVPYLVKSKGNIINVSTVNGIIRDKLGKLAYNMSKAALDQFTKCMALELASKGIGVNSVNPGLIKTNLHRRGKMDEDQYQDYLKRSENTHAWRRIGMAEEVAETIALLASDSASFITGCILLMHGGRHVMVP